MRAFRGGPLVAINKDVLDDLTRLAERATERLDGIIFIFFAVGS